MIVIQNPLRSSPSFVPVQRPQGPVQVQDGSGQTQHAGTCTCGSSSTPTHEQIALAAYDIYLEHGRAEGRSQLNWRQAEEELAQTPSASWPKSQVQGKA